MRKCASVLAMLLLTGCAAAAGQVSTTGEVTGRLVMEGGPLGPGGQQPGERSIPGTVVFTAAGHRVVVVQVGRTGRFAVRLLPGRYHVSGTSPRITESSAGARRQLPCSQYRSVAVTAGHTATVTVACIVP
jgi:hypothetical protein